MIAKIYLFYTGGTISMISSKSSDSSCALKPVLLNELLQHVHGLNFLTGKKYNSKDFKEGKPFIKLSNGNTIALGMGSFEKPVDSSNIGPDEWKEIALAIKKEYENYDGFVIIHGTDTMAFTASALSFMFENLSKPVVLTGSQLPLDHVRTDARLNLANAFYIAGYRASNLPLIPEVMIVFADKIIRGNRATKESTSSWSAFDSPNFPLLGTIGEKIKINMNNVLSLPKKSKKFLIKGNFDKNVFCLTLLPGTSNGQIKKIFEDSNIKGVLLRTYGKGNVCNQKGLLSTIENTTKKDKLIVNLSQCAKGGIHMSQYEASAGLLERGVISGSDMTTEAALTKIMWVLGTFSSRDREKKMHFSQRGEQMENLYTLKFNSQKQAVASNIYTSTVKLEKGLEHDRIVDARLHVSQLGVVGDKENQTVKIHIFWCVTKSNHQTQIFEKQLIGDIKFIWKDKVLSFVKNITNPFKSVCECKDITLSLKTEDSNQKIFFNNLCIAVYSKA